MLTDDDISEQEKFIQSKPWVCRTILRDDIHSMRFNSTIYYDDKSDTKTTRHVCPLRAIEFAEAKIARCTIWKSEAIEGINAIQFHPLLDGSHAQQSSFCLGQPQGIAVDFTMNARDGERIKCFVILLSRRTQKIVGISVSAFNPHTSKPILMPEIKSSFLQPKIDHSRSTSGQN